MAATAVARGADPARVHVVPNGCDLGLFGLAGIITIAALFCLNRALKLAPASLVVPYQYTMIVWAVIFGYAVFGDVPNAATLIGAVIITLAGLYIFLRERALGRTATLVDPPA